MFKYLRQLPDLLLAILQELRAFRVELRERSMHDNLRDKDIGNIRSDLLDILHELRDIRSDLRAIHEQQIEAARQITKGLGDVEGMIHAEIESLGSTIIAERIDR